MWLQDVEQLIPFIKPLFDGLRSAKDLFKGEKSENIEHNADQKLSTRTVLYVKDLQFSLAPQQGKPLSICGTVATAVDKVRVFVDHSLFFSGKWFPPKRTVVGEFREAFRGQPFEMQLICQATWKMRPGATGKVRPPS